MNERLVRGLKHVTYGSRYLYILMSLKIVAVNIIKQLPDLDEQLSFHASSHA